LKNDGSEDSKSPKIGGENAHRTSLGFIPSDVARRIFGSDSARATQHQSRQATTKLQREAIIESRLLNSIKHPRSIDAKGAEHAVCFRGKTVEKHQYSDGWSPQITPNGKLTVCKATPIEYLRRLDLQNELFGDDIQIIGLTRANRFVITQPTLRGGEPSENEIRDVLQEAGWQYFPIEQQDLPHQLMGSAWWHKGEQLILLDARKPNFKKTDYGTLPIDLILHDLTPNMKTLLP